MSLKITQCNNHSCKYNYNDTRGCKWSEVELDENGKCNVYQPKPKEIEKVSVEKYEAVISRLPKTQPLYLLIEGIIGPILEKQGDIIDAVNELRRNKDEYETVVSPELKIKG